MRGKAVVVFAVLCSEIATYRVGCLKADGLSVRIVRVVASCKCNLIPWEEVWWESGTCGGGIPERTAEEAAGLIVHTPCQLIAVWISYAINTSINQSNQMGVAPKYLRDAIRLPTSATSLRPLRSIDRRELFVPRTRTTMAMSRSFTVIAPSLWNRLPPSARAPLLSSNLSTSLSLLKTCLFSWS